MGISQRDLRRALGQSSVNSVESSDESILDATSIRPYAVPTEIPQNLRDIAIKGSEAIKVGVKPLKAGDSTGVIAPPPSPPPGCDVMRLPPTRAPKKQYLYHRDRVRQMILPQKNNGDHPVIISQNEYKRLMETASVLTEEERRALEEWRKEAKDKMYDQSRNRKEELQNMDKIRLAQHHFAASDVAEEDRVERQATLDRSRRQRLEDTQEMRQLNRCILNAKCMAIRQAQIQEKQLLQKEWDKEQRRMDMLMEVTRQKAIARQQREEEERKAKAAEFVAEIRCQQLELEFKKTLEAGRREQESAFIRKQEAQRMEDTIKDRERQERRRLAVKEEAIQEGEKMKRRKAALKEQERLENAKVAEWMRLKAEREAAIEAEADRQRKEKERQVARLGMMQQREMDLQAERDALRAQRIQEQVERAWRKKEREQSEARRRTQKDLKEAREAQIRVRNYCLGLEANREREDFMRILEKQKIAVEADKRKETEMHRRKDMFAKAMRQQIVEKADNLLEERRQIFLDGEKAAKERKDREQALDDLMCIKLQELKELQLPDKAIVEIKRCMKKAAQENERAEY